LALQGKAQEQNADADIRHRKQNLQNLLRIPPSSRAIRIHPSRLRVFAQLSFLFLRPKKCQG
jgi:hypothetical protein